MSYHDIDSEVFSPCHHPHSDFQMDNCCSTSVNLSICFTYNTCTHLYISPKNSWTCLRKKVVDVPQTDKTNKQKKPLHSFALDRRVYCCSDRVSSANWTFLSEFFRLYSLTFLKYIGLYHFINKFIRHNFFFKKKKKKEPKIVRCQ